MRGVPSMLAILVLLSPPTEAHAAVNWLTLRGECAADVEQLAQRIESEVAGARPPALSLTLELEAGANVRGHLWLEDGQRRVGEKHVEAASCEAALELMTAVAALALSSLSPSSAHPTQGATASSATPVMYTTARPALAAAPAHRAVDDADVTRSAQPRRWRLLAGAGVSLGASTPTTLLVAGGGAAALGRGELRLLGRYGAPATNDSVEADRRRVRRDFGSVAVDYCYGLDRTRWLSLCAGWEVLTRRTQVTTSSAQAERASHTQRSVLTGPVAGVSFVLREIVAQPQLELAALVPVWGAPPGFGFRAALGGGLPF